MARTHLSVIQSIDRVLREMPADAEPSRIWRALEPLRSLIRVLGERGQYQDFVHGRSPLGRAYIRMFKRHERLVNDALAWELNQRRAENEKRNRKIKKDMARVRRGMGE